MIEVDALVALLTVETLVLLSTLLAILLRRRARSRRFASEQAETLVDRVAEQRIHDPSRLKSLLGECAVDFQSEQAQSALQSLAEKQRDFYLHVIRAFLEQDLEKLAELDAEVMRLFEAQGNSLKRLVDAQTTSDHDRQEVQMNALRERVGELEIQLLNAHRTSAQLAERFDQTLHALEEVSTEYTKMFGGPKTAERLLASQERMLEVFRQATSAETTEAASDSDHRETEP